MRNNIITANAGDNQYVKTDSVFQYDYGLILKIDGITLPAEYEVHFCNKNSKAAKTVTGDENGVAVPDEYLRNGEDIHAYLYLENENEYGYTVYNIHIPVVDRAAIDTEEITPVEHTFVEDALKTIAEAVDKTDENVANYPYINENEYWMVYDAENHEYVNTGVKACGDNTFNLQIGSVTTLAPGSQATASITWEHGDARLNLGLPAGDTSTLVSIYDERSNVTDVTIHDGADNLGVSELLIGIEPVMTGSGTPSPQNIRRISGITGVTLTHVAGQETLVYARDWESEAGTVYGGTFNPLTGKLIVDRILMTKRCIDMDNMEVQPGWKNSGIRAILGENIDQIFMGQTLNVGTSFGVDTTGDNDILYLGYEQYYMRQTDWRNTELTIQIIVPLPEPVEYTLESYVPTVQLGDNRYYVNAAKIAHLKYPCDTKLYVDRKITEVQALVLEH